MKVQGFPYAVDAFTFLKTRMFCCRCLFGLKNSFYLGKLKKAEWVWYFLSMCDSYRSNPSKSLSKCVVLVSASAESAPSAYVHFYFAVFGTGQKKTTANMASRKHRTPLPKQPSGGSCTSWFHSSIVPTSVVSERIQQATVLFWFSRYCKIVTVEIL